MFMLTVILLALVAVPLTGGRLAGLATVRVRAVSLLVASLGLQIVVISIAADVLAHAVSEVLHLASYAIAGAFVVVNRRVPGLLLAASGGGLNVLAIAANGGVMPASRRALEAAGIPTAHEGFANSATVADAKLAWLGDVFAIPAHLPLANVFSVGDVVLMVGVAVTILALCGSRLTPRASSRWTRQREAFAAEDAARHDAADPTAPTTA